MGLCSSFCALRLLDNPVAYTRAIDKPVVHRRKLCSDEVLCSSEGLAAFQSVHATHTLGLGTGFSGNANNRYLFSMVV